MPITGLDAETCRRRNLAATLKGFDAVPVRLFARVPPGPDGYRRLAASAKLPTDPDAALARINSLIGRGDDPLRPDDVYLLYPEAMSTRFIENRWAFIAPDTLKNIAREAAAGFAFMNSHRTGGLSTPAELPYGRTFAGRFETWVPALGSGPAFSRTLLGVYMVRGQMPNGGNGPTTDDLYRSIDGGTVFDVSMGLYGGSRRCDVCGADLEGFDEDGNFLCPHVPGTTFGMGDDEVAAQEARGVPDGKATWTWYDAHAAEVSAVFDGAVPGAGFRKAVAFSRRGRLDPGALSQARSAYAAFGRGGEFDPRPAPTTPPGRARGGPAPRRGPRRMDKPTIVSAADLFRFWKAAGEPEEFDLEAARDELAREPGTRAADGGVEPAAPPAAPAPEAPAAPARPDPPAAPAAAYAPRPDDGSSEVLQQQIRALQDQLKTERFERERQVEEARRKTIKTEADSFAHEMISVKRLAVPAERANIIGQYSQAAMDDYAKPAKVPFMDPADNTPKTGSRVEALRATFGFRTAHTFGQEQTAADPAGRPAALATLYAGSQDGKDLGDTLYDATVKFAERRNRRGGFKKNGAA